jgi:phosphate transport system substrate-binding protein
MRKAIALSLLLTCALCACASPTSAPAAPAAPADPVAPAVPAEPEPVSGFDVSNPIALYTREDGSGTRGAFTELTGVGEDMSPEAAVFSETNEILTQVEENPFAISYVSLGSLTPGVKALSIDGVTPSTQTIKDGSFKIQRPFIVCVNAENAENELVQGFIAFMMSAEGQEISASKWIKADEAAPAYAASGLSGTLKVGGSTSVEPCMVEMVKRYNEFVPGVTVEISGGGSGTGISEATDGVVHIGMSSRELTDDETAALTPTVIAQDGVAVIVNQANPLENLTLEQVRQVFVGELTTWGELG